MKYQYSIVLKEHPSAQDDCDASLQFEIKSHDNVFEILERLRSLESFDDNTCAALAVGLKSLGSAIMSNRDSQKMSRLLPHFKELMKELKKGGTGKI